MSVRVDKDIAIALVDMGFQQTGYWNQRQRYDKGRYVVDLSSVFPNEVWIRVMHPLDDDVEGHQFSTVQELLEGLVAFGCAEAVAQMRQYKIDKLLMESE